MAKKNEMVKKEEVAPVKYEDVFEGYDPDEMAEVMGTTGTEDVPPEERRPPLYAWNLDMTDDFGHNVNKNVFYNCQTGEQQESVECALLGFKKTRERSERDQATGQKTIYCRSFDREMGQDAVTGNLVECKGCEFFFGKRGERKACAFVMKFVAYDFKKNEFFVFNATRSSIVPMTRFLERNFFGQYKNPKTRKRGDIPLYMMRVKLGLKEEEGHGNRYYVIDPEVMGPLSKDAVMDLLPMAQQVKSMSQQDYSKKFQGDGEERADAAPEVGDDDVPF